MKIATSKGIFDITVDENKANAKGEVYITCPICTPSRRREHLHDKKLAVNVKKEPKPWRCNHCGEAGFVLTDDGISRMKIKPLLKNRNSLQISDNLVKWFWEKRRISIETLHHFKIALSEESILQHRYKNEEEKGKWITKKVINYKYIKDDVLVNIKFRDNLKNFKMITGATVIPFNMDAIKNSKKCVIVEGENDAMAYHESGVPFVISVPNGASITETERKEYKETGVLKVISNINLEYLDLVIDDLKHIEMFYIATDDDAPGIKLREELARRLGYERCKYIKFGEFKNANDRPINDPNELLIEHSKAKLKSTLETAHSFPIADVNNADQYLDTILRTYREGKSKGISTGFISLNPHFNWVRGWTIAINGFPNMGKTSFALNLICASTVLYKWKWGIFCPENYPVEDVIETIAMILIGKPISKEYSNRITEGELILVIRDFIDKYFFFIDNEDGFTPEEMRAIKKRLIQQNGIVGFLTDPWSSLNHDVKGNIDEYLQNELNKEVRLSTKYNLINLINHHPRTPKNKADATIPPSLFELTGGKTWWMKVYAGLCVHQESYDDWRNNRVGIHIQKIKDKQKAGETTNANNYPLFRYDMLSRRFYEKEDITEENSPFKRFPFKNYLDTDQQSLFNGF